MEGKRRSDETPVPMARVVDGDGRTVCTGWYARLRKSSYCFAEDEPEGNAMECVVVDEPTDWGLPNRHVVKEVSPPHRIEAVESATTLYGRFEERRRIEGWTCSACGAAVVRGGTLLPSYCSNCGRKVSKWGR
ncbi:hypothetical protein [Slackia exigua]|mgnify:CR=1 FL=1|uniref:hypothetical protein n=1 Tax=Slackia exigua TaxID=84109 RepID=UPI0023F2D161|nr:hypothetical protein [Slackia exigua]